MKKKPLARIGDLDKADPKCKTCEGIGWVCEDHPHIASNGGATECCGGAGMPCTCNPLSKFKKNPEDK